MIREKDILNYYHDKIDSEESKHYLSTHAKRYIFLLSLIQRFRQKIPLRTINIMDIGPSFFTEQLQIHFPSDRIYSLGYIHTQSRGGHLPQQVCLDKTSFIHFDLNTVQNREKWISPPSCSIIVMAEVIEHLHTAPSIVLNFLSTFLEHQGYIIIQTPNAVSLYKRIQVLLGKNPYEMIRENAENPGHFREYTRQELFVLAQKSGFSTKSFTYSNYFRIPHLTFKMLLYRVAQFMLGKSFFEGMTIVLQKK